MHIAQVGSAKHSWQVVCAYSSSINQHSEASTAKAILLLLGMPNQQSVYAASKWHARIQVWGPSHAALQHMEATATTTNKESIWQQQDDSSRKRTHAVGFVVCRV
eukprot:GHRR01036063.1.p1 GENE.GHRR01036063.1~~GHRR01036063.1.p1  ORF type:complete len:122 (-),score=46.91 GHRR01036063.1:774-1088(-)